jgi:DNA-binding MarR family transcriptional regulator
MVRSVDVDDLAGDLYEGIALTARRLRQVQTAGELPLPERAVLSRLDRHGPATAAALARTEQVSPQAMGITLGALVQRGFVERRRDPSDGRRIIMSLTAGGRNQLRHKRDSGARQLAEVLARRFTATELETLAAAVPLIEHLGESI